MSVSARKTRIDKMIHRSEENATLSLFSERILAIDASCYAIRMVLCDHTLKILDSLECQPHETAAASQFVSAISRKYPYIRTVGSPLSRWPSNLEKVLWEQGIKVEWLSPDMMRDVGHVLAPWNKKRRLLRASLLAYLAKQNPLVGYRTAREHILFWEGHVAHETLCDVQSELCFANFEGFAE